MKAESFINLTKTNFEEFFFYENFMKKSTNEEFLKSQIPFYNAVENFPRAICYLAYLIPNSFDRLKIAENIWEEHGQGDSNRFHTNTFSNFLKSIGNGNYTMFHNPKIDKWINSWFEEKSIYKLSLKLAAIEYMYALISQSIAEHCDRAAIFQDHYTKHSIIDWSHGYDLLQVALKYNTETEQETLYRFTQYQKEFINVYKSMVVMTQKDIEEISKEKIAFRFLRENSDITRSNVSLLNNVVIIGSGGESLLNICEEDKNLDILVIDMNPNQLHLINDKIKDYDKASVGTGKFEKIFEHLRNRFSFNSIDNRHIHDELKYALDDIFSRENLSGIFGEDAVKYTSKSFSDHFYNVFTSKHLTAFDEENFSNIFCNTPFYGNYKSNVSNKVKFVNRKIDSKEIIDAIISHFSNDDIDVIDLSNIGDWIPLETLIDILKEIYNKMRPEGSLVIRRLLGDYSLVSILEDIGFYVSDRYDSFYEETVIGFKK